MKRVTVDRIRRATFPTARNGYNKRAVEKFLDAVADWLETGRGDPARSELLRNDLRRIAHRAAGMLAEAEEGAQQLRAEARRDADLIVQRAHEEAARIRSGADPAAAPARTRPPADHVRRRADRQAR